MPKMRTHKGTAKRIRETGSGKLVRKQCGASHLMAKKSRSRKRRLKLVVMLARPDQQRIKALLGTHRAKSVVEGGNDQG